MLRTINNIVCTLLLQAHLLLRYRVKALEIAEHLVNILPSTTIKNDTPFHKLYCKTLVYDHLRVFGCLCFPNFIAPSKLSPRSTPCVFLGYPTNHKGYRCLNIHTKQIVICRHMVFYETVFLFRAMTRNIAPSHTFLKHGYFPSVSSSTNDLSSSDSDSLESRITNERTPHESPSPITEDNAPYESSSLIADDPPSSPVTPYSHIPPSTTTSHHPMINPAKRGIKKPIGKLDIHVHSSSTFLGWFFISLQSDK